MRRLVVWREPGGEVVRDVPLHPGLNVVWSPDPGDSGPDEGPRSPGHGSGKTLFCRLLRYCLGEARCAPEAQRRRIAEGLKDGLVGAEVVLDGEPWSVIRSIGHLRRQGVFRGAKLEEVDHAEIGRGNLRELRDAIVSSILTPEVASLLPGAADDAWETTLAWLSRDQECRFAHPLVWRDSDSDSGSPALGLGASGALEAIRALIGAMDSTEPEVRRREAALARQRIGAAEAVDRLEWHVHRERVRLAHALDLGEAGAGEGAIALEVMRSAAKRRVVVPVELGALDEQAADWDAVSKELGEARVDLARIQARIEGLGAVLKLREDEAGLLALRDLTGVACPLCRVPVSTVLAEGCGISEVATKLHDVHQRRQGAIEELERARSDLAQRQAEGAACEAAVVELAAREKRLRPLAIAARHAARESAESALEGRMLVADVSRLERQISELADARSELARIDADLVEVRARLGEYRERHRLVVDALSNRFEEIVRCVLPSATASVRVTGTTLELAVILDGDRTTPAYNSLKVLAFDLAVLTSSVEGRNYVPTFLLHDSPREADLGASLYAAWFDLIAGLERVAPVAPFQYIISTTTAPPHTFREPPYRVLKLHGSPAEYRFLKVNL